MLSFAAQAVELAMTRDGVAVRCDAPNKNLGDCPLSIGDCPLLHHAPGTVPSCTPSCTISPFAPTSGTLLLPVPVAGTKGPRPTRWFVSVRSCG